MKSLIAFDLDDTLYKERSYLRSGHRVIADRLAAETGADASELLGIISAGHPRGIEDALDYLARRGTPSALSVDQLVAIYRMHRPHIELSAGFEQVLAALKGAGHILALITDGGSAVQRGKIASLGLERFIDPKAMIISGETGFDKHSPQPFGLAEELMPGARRYYVADNIEKDFVYPNMRGWTSVMLADPQGLNVRPQVPSAWPAVNRPFITIDSPAQLLKLI